MGRITAYLKQGNVAANLAQVQADLQLALTAEQTARQAAASALESAQLATDALQDTNASNLATQIGALSDSVTANATALALKADAAALALKADASALALKADASALSDSVTANATALALKADASALAGKADVSAISGLAPQSAVDSINATLTSKLEATDIAHIEAKLPSSLLPKSYTPEIAHAGYSLPAGLTVDQGQLPIRNIGNIQTGSLGLRYEAGLSSNWDVEFINAVLSNGVVSNINNNVKYNGTVASPAEDLTTTVPINNSEYMIFSVTSEGVSAEVGFIQIGSPSATKYVGAGTWTFIKFADTNTLRVYKDGDLHGTVELGTTGILPVIGATVGSVYSQISLGHTGQGDSTALLWYAGTAGYGLFGEVWYQSNALVLPLVSGDAEVDYAEGNDLIIHYYGSNDSYLAYSQDVKGVKVNMVDASTFDSLPSSFSEYITWVQEGNAANYIRNLNTNHTYTASASPAFLARRHIQRDSKKAALSAASDNLVVEAGQIKITADSGLDVGDYVKVARFNGAKLSSIDSSEGFSNASVADLFIPAIDLSADPAGTASQITLTESVFKIVSTEVVGSDTVYTLDRDGLFVAGDMVPGTHTIDSTFTVTEYGSPITATHVLIEVKSFQSTTPGQPDYALPSAVATYDEITWFVNETTKEYTKFERLSLPADGAGFYVNYLDWESNSFIGMKTGNATSITGNGTVERTLMSTKLPVFDLSNTAGNWGGWGDDSDTSKYYYGNTKAPTLAGSWGMMALTVLPTIPLEGVRLQQIQEVNDMDYAGAEAPFLKEAYGTGTIGDVVWDQAKTIFD